MQNKSLLLLLLLLIIVSSSLLILGGSRLVTERARTQPPFARAAAASIRKAVTSSVTSPPPTTPPPPPPPLELKKAVSSSSSSSPPPVENQMNSSSASLWPVVGCGSSHPIFECKKSYSINEEEFNRYPQLRRGGRGKRKSCALVGSSANLLNFKLGKDIDSRDVVIRMNGAPTRGCEKHVGNRTDVVILNLSGFSCGPDGIPRNHPLLLINSVQDMNVKSTGIAGECKRKYGRKIYSVSDFLRFLPNLASNEYHKRYRTSASRGRHMSSSGVKGLFFGLLVCDVVHVYGFGLLGIPANHTNKYYGGSPVKTLLQKTTHDWQAEAKLIVDLSRNKFNWTWIDNKDYRLKDHASVVLHGQPLLQET
ncbi:type 2 lactosamine alpha-2,3-sialyltransferase-like isoform X2 [Oscarella lobularis]|uniref:type 2 lactosamine alpha-2,3-sialyltransferase-like isoform X2 n=1 Tax=Oscarella lobularis TaxID=121494 RepID=UPI0033141105